MLTTPSSNRQKKLYQAGLIVGLAGVVLITLFALAVSEAPFSMYAVPMALIFSLPFLAMVGVAWKWPVTGSILLIAAGLFWPVWRLTTMPPTSQPMPLATLALVILPVSLLPLASGILFLLSWRAKEAK